MSKSPERIKQSDDRSADWTPRSREPFCYHPNVAAHPSCPAGAIAADNAESPPWGAPPNSISLPEAALGSLENAPGNPLDLARRHEIAGARFAVFTNGASPLARASPISFLAVHTREHGYTESCRPSLVNTAITHRRGQLPKFSRRSLQSRDSDLA